MTQSHRREKTPPIFVLNGPNLNLLGSREPQVYGTATLKDIENAVRLKADSLGWTVVFRQTNSEGDLLDWLHEARANASGVILNAGAFSHTSIALLDACRALERPLIEVHLSNPYRREPFRHHSFVSETATGVICGLGSNGYVLAIEALSRILKAGSP
jgi:3-dehydroquinate dehydratase II